MGSMKTWMFGAALAAGIVGLGAAPAQAARVGVYIGVAAPVAYAPPCPGPGYVWVAGYWNDGYWVPGYWNFVGAGPVYRGYDYDRAGAYYRGGWDRDDFRRDRDDWRYDRDDRRFDRDDRHFDHDWDHDRR